MSKIKKMYNTTEFVNIVDKQVDKHTNAHVSKDQLTNKLAKKSEFKGLEKKQIRDIIAAVLKAQGKVQVLTPALIKAVLDASHKDIMKIVKSNCGVNLYQYGTIRPSHRKPRKGRNPQTGKPLKVPASTSANFRLSTKFKNYLN